MKKFGGFLLSFCALALFLLPQVSEAAVQTIATGVIRYPDGTGIPSAKVEMYTANSSIFETYTTDASGNFTITHEENTLNGNELTIDIKDIDGYMKPEDDDYPLTFTYALGDAVRTIDWTYIDAPKTVTATVRNDSGELVNADVYAYSTSSDRLTGSATGNDGVITLYLTGGEWVINTDANLSSTDASSYPWMYTGSAEAINFNNDATAESTSLDFTVTAADSLVSVTFQDVNGDVLTGNNFSADITFVRSDGVSTRRKVDSTTGQAQVYLLPGIYRAWPDHEQIDSTQTFLESAITFVVKEVENKDLGTIQAVAKGSTLVGKLVNKKGTGISGAEIILSRQQSPERTSAITDDNGSFSVAVGPGEYSVGLGDSGLSADYQLLSSKTVVIETNSESVDLGNLKAAKRNMTLDGTVSCDQNFSGMVVAQSTDGVNSFYAAISSGSYSMVIPTSRVSTEYLNLDVITQPGSACYLKETEQVKVSTTAKTKNLTLNEEKAIISGSITDMNGNNLSSFGTTVEVIATSTNGSVEKVSVGTDGLYSMTVAPRKWRLGVHLEDEDSATIIPPAGSYYNIKAENNTTKTKNLAVHSKVATINGQVTDNNGISVGSAPIIITNLGNISTKKELAYISTVTDAAGNYSASVPVGTFKVLVGSTPDVTSLLEPEIQSVTVASGATETINLAYRSGGVTISGTVSAAKNIVRGKVVAYSTDGGYAEDDLSENNEYALNLAAGDWKIVASGLVNNKLYVSTQKKRTVSEATSLDFTLKSTGQDVPGVASTSGEADDLLVASNEKGVTAIIEPYGAVVSGTVYMDLIPVPEVLPTAEGTQASVAYELKIISDNKEVTQLKRPATIIMPLAEYGLIKKKSINENRLAAQYWSPDEELWQPNGVTGIIDTVNNRVVLHVDHLTRFSMLSKMSKSSAPKKIKNLRVKKFKKSIKVRARWKARTKAITYKVQLRKGAKKIKTFTVTSTNRKLIKKKFLKASKKYKFRVRGINYWGQKGKWSKYKKFRT